MIQENEIGIAASKYIEDHFIGGEDYVSSRQDSFVVDGVCADADENPKDSWISVNDDLPCNHEELLNAKYETKKVFTLKSGGFPDVDYMLKVDGKWIWFTNKSTKFWMPIPEIPKEV